MLAYYKGNPEIALLSLFPEIGLQRSKFTSRKNYFISSFIY